MKEMRLVKVENAFHYYELIPLQMIIFVQQMPQLHR